MNILGEIFAYIVLGLLQFLFEKLAHLIFWPFRSLAQKRREEKSQLSYEEVKKRVDKGNTHLIVLLIHFSIFVLMCAAYENFQRPDLLTLLGGFWILFVLLPHVGGVIFYVATWSSKELDRFDTESDKRKSKPKRAS